MKFYPQAIPEVILIDPLIHGDNRGYFFESFRKDKFEEAVGGHVKFVQENESKSTKGVLRGLHFQTPPFAQSKLVRVIQGCVLDLAVDIRKGSPTYGNHVAVVLSDENKHQLFIPRGFAHGFVVLSDLAIFSYKVDNYYSAEHDRGIYFADPILAIDWQMPENLIRISQKDKNQLGFQNFQSPFDYEES